MFILLASLKATNVFFIECKLSQTQKTETFQNR
jgi:hypothetical protein